MAYPSPYGGVTAPRPPAAPSRLPGYGALPATPARTVNPDYQRLLGGDLALQGTLQGLSAQGAQNQLGYQGARNQALIGYGAVPGGLQGIDQTTRGLAEANTGAQLSTLGQLQRGYERQQSADVGSLAGRGILHSGAYLQHSRENLYDLTAGSAHAQEALLSHLADLAANQQTANAGLADRGYDATSSALSRIIAQINAGLIAPTRTAAAPARLRNAPQVARNAY